MHYIEFLELVLAQKSIRSRDLSESNANIFASNFENEFISRFLPHSNPNEYAGHLVNCLKKGFVRRSMIRNS